MTEISELSLLNESQNYPYMKFIILYRLLHE